MLISLCFFLADNQAAWERYEQKRDELFKKLDGADTELENINQVNCVFPVLAGIIQFFFDKFVFCSSPILLWYTSCLLVQFSSEIDVSRAKICFALLAPEVNSCPSSALQPGCWD